MTIIKIETDINERVESGPLQINDDWPGYFMRGDTAFGTAVSIRQALECGNEEVLKLILEELADELETVEVK